MIKLVSLPTGGVLTISEADAVIDTEYAYDVVLTYTSNDNECASSYSDSFIYKVIDDL